MNRKRSILIVALVILALAVFVAVGLDGNKATAFSNGWNGGCATCHPTGSGTGIHVAGTYPTHASSGCTSCHELIGDTPALAKCVVCHGSATVIAAANTTHSADCTSASCHPAPTTTTSTTEAPTTTTSTTEAPTTTTTLRDDDDNGQHHNHHRHHNNRLHHHHQRHYGCR